MCCCTMKKGLTAIYTTTMYSGKHPSPPEHVGKKKQRRTGPLSFHIGKITQGLADLRGLDDTQPKTFEKLDDVLLSRIMSMGTVKEVGSMGRRYARLTKEQRKKGLRDNPELIKRTEKATMKMKKTVGRLREKGYDMAGPIKGDRGHTRAWLAAIEAADAIDL